MHHRHVGSFYRHLRHQYSLCPNLRMSVNRASMILNFSCCVIHVQIVCRHPMMRYCQPSGAKTTATCSLLHSEYECPRRVTSFCSWICGNEGVAQIVEHITELWPAWICTNRTYQTKNTDSKLIDITNCKTFKYVLSVVDYAILVRYYYQTTKIGALYESIDGTTGWPAGNLPKPYGLGDYHWTVPKSTIQVNWQPRTPMGQPFGLDPDLNLKGRSCNITQTREDRRIESGQVPAGGTLWAFLHGQCD